MEKFNIETKKINFTHRRNALIFFTIYILLYLSYCYQIQPLFAYAGFGIEENSLIDMFIGTLLIILFILVGINVKDYFFYVLYSCIFAMNFIPAIILSICMGWKLAPLLSVIMPLLTLVLLDKFTSRNVVINPPKIAFNKKKAFKWFIIVFLLVIPYFSRYDMINLSNLLFQDVYDSRALAKSIRNPYFGYTISLLLRYLLPFLLIYFIHVKKRMLSIIVVMFILLLYLTTGSLKGHLVYIFLMVFLSFGVTQYQKIGRFITLLLGIIGVGAITYLINGTEFIITYVRRSFFIGELLSRQYSDYFKGNFTYYEHTKIASIFDINSKYRSSGTITNWFGEYVIGSGTNASVGSFIEGYFSFGVPGILVACIVFSIVSYIVRNCKIERKYIGITALGCYVFFMSQIEMAFITNGLVFFLLLCLYVYPRGKLREFIGNKKNNKIK